jgi:hypothetical protein
MQQLSDKVFSAPAVETKAAPPPAAPTLARTQYVSHPTIPVSKDAPVPRAPSTNSRGMPDTVTVPSHIPVTDAMSEDPRPVPSLEPVDAAMFPSLEETRLAIPSRRVKRNAENKAAREEQRKSVPGATGPTPTPLPAPHVARIDDDDGHIPLRTSRVRPMFASVATQKAMKDHQTATTMGNQACAVQGRSKSGQAKSVPSTEESVTHATIIRHGGLPDAEAERALRTKPPHFLVQAAQRALDRLSRQSPRILHGSWSLNYDQTRNFSLVLSGNIPARELLKYKTQLCEPFLGAETDLVPARGWSWAQLRNVPTVDEEGLVWSPKDLFHTFIANPCFAEALICAPPTGRVTPFSLGKRPPQSSLLTSTRATSSPNKPPKRASTCLVDKSCSSTAETARPWSSAHIVTCSATTPRPHAARPLSTPSNATAVALRTTEGSMITNAQKITKYRGSVTAC